MAKFSRFFIGLIVVVFAASAPFSFAANRGENLPSVEVNLDVLEQLRRDALGLPPEPPKPVQKPVKEHKKPATPKKKQEVKKASQKAEPKTEIVKQEPKIEETKNLDEIVLPKEVEEPKKEEKSAEGSPQVKDLITEKGALPIQKIPEAPTESGLKKVEAQKEAEAVKTLENDPLAYLTKPNITDTKDNFSNNLNKDVNKAIDQTKEAEIGGAAGAVVNELVPVVAPAVVGNSGGAGGASVNSAKLPSIDPIKVDGVAGNGGVSGSAVPSAEIPSVAPAPVATEKAVGGGAPTPELPKLDAVPQIPDATTKPAAEPTTAPAEEKGFIQKILDSVMNIIKSITDFIMGLLGSNDKTEVVPPPPSAVSGTEKAPAADIAIPGIPAVGEVKSAIEEKKEEVKAVVNETADATAAKVEAVGEKAKAAEGATAEVKTEAAKVLENPKTESALPEVQKLGGTAAAAVEILKELPTVPAAPTEAAPPADAKPEEKKSEPAVEQKKDDNVLLKLEFLPGGTELTQEMNEKLDVLSKQILEAKNTRYTIVSYASNGTEEGSARKNSLKRALEVRKYLIGKGIDSSRVNVQAMGDATTEPPFDRIEITPSVM